MERVACPPNHLGPATPDVSANPGVHHGKADGMIAGCEDGRNGLGERIRAGLAAVAARRRKGGHKPAVTEDKLERAREHVAEGLAVHETAMHMKIGKTALYQALTVEGA